MRIWSTPVHIFDASPEYKTVDIFSQTKKQTPNLPPYSKLPPEQNSAAGGNLLVYLCV